MLKRATQILVISGLLTGASSVLTRAQAQGNAPAPTAQELSDKLDKIKRDIGGIKVNLGNKPQGAPAPAPAATPPAPNAGAAAGQNSANGSSAGGIQGPGSNQGAGQSAGSNQGGGSNQSGGSYQGGRSAQDGNAGAGDANSGASQNSKVKTTIVNKPGNVAFPQVNGAPANWVPVHWTYNLGRWVSFGGHYADRAVPPIPAPQNETVTMLTPAGKIWVAGHYIWDGKDWVWIFGHHSPAK